MATGRVKWFNENKGFGFIEDESGKDVFVHYTAIQNLKNKILPEGAIVDYELKNTERGSQAFNVKLIERNQEF